MFLRFQKKLEKIGGNVIRCIEETNLMFFKKLVGGFQNSLKI